MPLKGMLSRPSTSAGTRQPSSTVDPASTKAPSPHAPNSPERSRHRKIGSLQRLSLSFPPADHGSWHPFAPLMTHEPDDLSPRPSLAGSASRPASRPGTSNTVSTSMVNSQSDSARRVRPTREEAAPPPPPHRLSLLRFRPASEPQLSSRYKETAPTDEAPPPPTIITTAPTQHLDEHVLGKSKTKFLPRTWSNFRKSMVVRDDGALPSSRLVPGPPAEGSTASAPNLIQAMSEHSPWRDRSDTQSTTGPPAYGDESTSALALPVTRLSESGGSEGSSGSHKLYAQTTTTHLIETTTTIFRLTRRKDKKKTTKDKGPLFPLPEKRPPPSSDSASTAPGRKSISPSRTATQNIRWKQGPSQRDTPHDSPTASMLALTNAPLGSPGPAIVRHQAPLGPPSGTSTPTGTLVPPRMGARGRSSTMGSLGRSSERLADTPSGRTSISTTGRRSFGDILTHRLRKDAGAPRHGSTNSGSTPGSKSNSFQIARESEPELVYPQRDEADTPATYLEKLEAAVPRGAMASVLCKSADDFSKTCLRKYMRGFSYFGESIDMSIRKMLMEVILPKETQQIDRLLAGFADRYHECNPGIFVHADEANFVAFSILLLQSDHHNKANKRKMTKHDYAKNTQNGRISVADDVLDCFYDNICYTPFIHFDDEIALNNHRRGAPKRRTGLMRAKSTEILRGPVDPYTLILEQKLDLLRPSLKDVIETDDPYATAPIHTAENHRAFVHAAVLQIVSARSRPEAFAHQATITNPAEAQVGLVSIKVAKVGLLWRKSAKKKKAKSPWQEWGVILTDAKLYFFKDVGWVKKLIAQSDSATKTPPARSGPVVFKPPLPSFDPDAWMAVDDAVALTDATYRRHKHAFTFIKHGGFEEIFLANSDTDMADWGSKLNYAATFRTAAIRMRGLLGTSYEGRPVYRQDSDLSMHPDASPTTEQATPLPGHTNPQLAWEIMFYRRQLVSEKISALEDHLAAAQKELDYLLRNARHLLILLPIQQKTREAVVFAAGRMNAKLKWTRKEIWRAKVHRDILIKDLEAEATSAFPAPAAVSSQGHVPVATPSKTTPTKGIPRASAPPDHDPASRATVTKSPAMPTPAGAAAGRRRSHGILDPIPADHAESPERSQRRRRSTSSQIPSSPRTSARLGDDKASDLQPRTPSVHTQASQHLSTAGDSQALTDGETDENVRREAGLPSIDGAVARSHERRGSESGRESMVTPGLPHPLLHEHSLKDRAGSVRRSLQRTLRDSSSHVHAPHHARSKKGRESGSSVTATDEGRTLRTRDSEELKRDPTGKFVLHGKKASVITMGPEWPLSSEDRMKRREPLSADRPGTTGSDPRGSLHSETGIMDPPPQRVRPADEVSLGGEKPSLDISNRKSMADSNRLSLYSALTTPAGARETFHSAESSPRQSSDDDQEGSDPEGIDDEDESTGGKNQDGRRTGLTSAADLGGNEHTNHGTGQQGTEGKSTA